MAGKIMNKIKDKECPYDNNLMEGIFMNVQIVGLVVTNQQIT